MRERAFVLVAAGILLAWGGQTALSNGNPNGAITISPQTLILGGSQGGRVTVHTDIKLVGQPEVTLNGIPARAVFADDRGELVAKFSERAVKAIVSPPAAELTLYVDGKNVGSDTVRVIE